MRYAKEDVLPADISYAQEPTPWDLGNDILYAMCRQHSGHRRADEIIAKIWLIGRSYAAAIERRKNADDTTSDDFYERDVVNAMQSSGIDTWLESLPAFKSEPQTCARAAIEAHFNLVRVFSKLAHGQEKHSLASKYLHFHRPDVFFIYDSRAQAAITRVTPDIHFVDPPTLEKKDELYWQFFSRCLWLRRKLAVPFGQPPTPREIDKVLLSVFNRKR